MLLCSGGVPEREDAHVLRITPNGSDLGLGLDKSCVDATCGVNRTKVHHPSIGLFRCVTESMQLHGCDLDIFGGVASRDMSLRENIELGSPLRPCLVNS